MSAFVIGIIVALVLGIGSDVIYDYAGVETATLYAPEPGVHLPQYAKQPLVSGELASAALAE